jgi:hypothetical protein
MRESAKRTAIEQISGPDRAGLLDAHLETCLYPRQS